MTILGPEDTVRFVAQIAAPQGVWRNHYVMVEGGMRCEKCGRRL